MNTSEVLQRFEGTVSQYLHELDGISMEQLMYQPSKEEWSLGQMYKHLIESALYMQLRNIEQCLVASADLAVVEVEKTSEGAEIFAQGSFPPILIQVPASPQYTPKQPESKEELIQGLHMVMNRMKGIEPELEGAPLRNKAIHPRFGALHAKEWFLLIEMHYRHHLLQMERLQSSAMKLD